MQDWVCLRKSKVFTNAHTEKLNQETLDIFFDMLYEILYNGFLEDANAVYCIFDTSESGFAAHPNWRKMLFKKSTKENQLLIPACSKAMSTVVFFDSASGSFMPPLFVYRGHHLCGFGVKMVKKVQFTAIPLVGGWPRPTFKNSFFPAGKTFF